MRVLFFGTPQFAADVLEIILGGMHEVAGLVSRVDQRAGRGLGLSEPAAVTSARRAGLQVLQPRRLHSDETLEEIRRLRPDVILTAAFGRILKDALLDLPPQGCWNVHASLLPRHRGASPVAAAIDAGDLWTGVTIFRMDAGLDTGPILLQEMTEIRHDDTGGSLTDRLAGMGGRLALRCLDLAENGRLHPVPQPDEGATYAPLLTRAHGLVQWDRPADVIERRIRALTPWPGAYAFLQGKRLRIHSARPAHLMPVRPAHPDPAHPDLAPPGSQHPPGTLVGLDDGVGVVCSPGLLRLIEVQAEGRKRQSAGDWARGQRHWQGRRFDD